MGGPSLVDGLANPRNERWVRFEGHDLAQLRRGHGECVTEDSQLVSAGLAIAEMRRDVSHGQLARGRLGCGQGY